MIRAKKYILAFVLLLVSICSYSQFYNTGSAPYKVKWQFIKTDHFKLIFPLEAEFVAQKFASNLTELYPYTSQSLNHKPAPIDIIMYNQNVLSNAYVVWAPKRMEVITTSPQRLYAQDWLEQLALHEYRHVVQIDKLNQGFTKGLSFFTGEMGVGAMMAFVPLWFVEGDAIVNETALTNTGRGRDPNFIQEVMAAEMQEEKRFKYDEFYMGSYKNYIPNHYAYGYQMVAWSRMQFGEEIWSKVLDNVGRRPFSLAPFYFKLKKETGLSKVQLYEKTSDYLHDLWFKEDSIHKPECSHIIPIETSYKSKFVSYRFSHENVDGTVLALRTSIDDIAKLVEIDKGKEKILFRLGYFQGSKIAYSQKYIAWEEIQTDPRWEQKNFSVIRLFNRQTMESNVFIKGERHFAPDVSPNSSKICLVNNSTLNTSYLEVYNILTKQLLNIFEVEENEQISFPTWIDESRIAYVLLGAKGKSIELVDIETRKRTNLLESGFENISYLSGSADKIYFSYTLNGRVNIYSIDIASKALSQLSSLSVGGNFARVGKSIDTLLFSEYTSKGFKPRKISIPEAKQIPLSGIQPYHYKLADVCANQENINIQDSILPSDSFISKPYSKFGHMFNIHSWLIPFYINLDEIPNEELKIYPGFTLLSQNSLSSVTSSFSYYYSGGYNHIRPSISFRMFYPVVTFSYLYGGPPHVNTQLAKPIGNPTELKTYQEYSTELSVPLKFSTSRYTISARPSLLNRYSNGYIADSNFYENSILERDNIFYYKGKSTIDFRFNFYLATKLAYKDLLPRWGINYYVSHLKPLLHSQYWQKNTVQIVAAYIPGPFRHQSLKLLYAQEKGFGMRSNVPRGYLPSDFINYNSAQKYSVDYVFPLFYPNLSIGPIAYFKRLQATVYYDYFEFRNTTRALASTKSSTGVELGIETNLFRFFWTFVPTIRYSYLVESEENNWNFFFTTRYGFSLGGVDSSFEP